MAIKTGPKSAANSRVRGIKPGKVPQNPAPNVDTDAKSKGTSDKAVGAPKGGATSDAFDANAEHILQRNPYSFDAAGQTPISDERVQSFDRLGLGAMNAVSARIAMMTGAGGAKAVDTNASIDSGAILNAVASHPHLTGPIADGIPSVQELMPPIADFASARRQTVDALANFSVARADGSEPMSLLEKIEGSNLSESQVARAVDVFTEFQHSLGLRDFDPGSSDINWKHVCGEAAQVIDAANKQGLSPEQTEVALLASLFSDAVKFPATLLTHNIDGAVGAYHVLNRRGDVDKDTMAAIVSATKEHQVGPPSFMAMLTSFRLHGVKDSVDTGGADNNALIESIQLKMSTPLDPDHVTTEGGASKIAFTPDEQKLMDAAGIHEWAVPSPKTPWFDASMAVITGDSLVNYAMPEGVGKIVALSGPGTMFKNPTVFDSMFSNGASFLDARSLLPESFQELADEGAELTKRGIDVVRQQVGSELSTGALSFPAKDFDAIVAQEKVDLGPLSLKRDGDQVRVDVPGSGDDVPYFHRPLDFEAGEVEGAKSDPSYEFAKLIRRSVADALRGLSPSALTRPLAENA